MLYDLEFEWFFNKNGSLKTVTQLMFVFLNILFIVIIIFKLSNSNSQKKCYK